MSETPTAMPDGKDVKESIVSMAIADVFNELSTQYTLLQGLELKLRPVLEPKAEVNVLPGNDTNEPRNMRVVDHVTEARRAIEKHNNMIRHLLDTLEV